MSGSNGRMKGWKPHMYASRQQADKARTKAIPEVVDKIIKLRVEDNEILIVQLHDVGEHFRIKDFANDVAVRLRDKGLHNLVLVSYNEQFSLDKIPEDTILQLAEDIKKKREVKTDG